MDFTRHLNQLAHKLALWEEEVKVHGDETEMTVDDVVRLEREITALWDSLDAAQSEARRLIAL